MVTSISMEYYLMLFNPEIDAKTELTGCASVFAKIQKYEVVPWKRFHAGMNYFTTKIFQLHLFHYINT